MTIISMLAVLYGFFAGEKGIFPREWFDEYIEVPFEDYTFRIPRMYDKILKHIYGDYMKLLPENERVGHHDYQVYKKSVYHI